MIWCEEYAHMHQAIKIRRSGIAFAGVQSINVQSDRRVVVPRSIDISLV